MLSKRSWNKGVTVRLLLIALVCASAWFIGASLMQGQPVNRFVARAAPNWSWMPDYTILPDDFSIVVLPDTQYYSDSYPEIYRNQVQWISAFQYVFHTAYVAHLGDIVNSGDNDLSEWDTASQAMAVLESPSRPIPYGVLPGNHDHDIYESTIDTGTVTFNSYFSAARLQAAFPANYGGHYGTNNDNNYMLFSASGMKFIVINLAYDGRYERTRYSGMPLPPANDPVLQWARAKLDEYYDRRAIVVSHYLQNPDGTLGLQGQAAYTMLKSAPNLFMMLSGHMGGTSTTPGESWMVREGGMDVMLSDYQSMSNGGDGWLRVLTFSPSRNKIFVRTYSPWRNDNLTAPWERTGATSKFDLVYNMGTDAYESEPNNTTATADVLAVNGRKMYGVTDSGANDVYAFTVSAPGEVGIFLEATATYVGWQLNTGQVGNDGELQTFYAPAAGTYYLTINGYSGIHYALSLYPASGWTSWLNRDDPSGSGDWETRQDFPGVCPEPRAIDARTTTGQYWYQTGEKLIVSPYTGLICQTVDQSDGACLDYQVRFFCSN